MKRLVSALAVIVLSLSIGIFIIQDPAAAFGQEVRVGSHKVMPSYPYFVALENGYFKEEGLELEKIEFQTSNQIVEALASGKIDVAVGPAVFVTFCMEANEPGRLKIFMSLDETAAKEYAMTRLVIRKDSGISEIADLKGRKMGVFPGVNTKTFAIPVFKAYSLDTGKDMEIIEIPPPLELQALATGQVDALFTLEPIATQCVVEGVGEIMEEVTPARYIMDPMVGGGYLFSKKFLKKDPEKAAKFRRAIFKAVDWIRENEAEAREVLPEYMPITREVALKCARNRFGKLSEKDVERFQRMIDFYYEYGLLSERIDAEDLIISETDFERD